MTHSDVHIIGGGVIGLSIGWQLARKGLKVEIFERDKAGRSAGWVSAGMLSPHAEMGFEEIELFKLGRISLDMYPKFLEELYEDSGAKVSFEKCGSLMVGFDRDDTERLRRLYEFRDKVGLPVHWITGSEARELEPMLSPKCTSSIWIPDDAQVNNRELIDAVKSAFKNRGGILHENTQVKSIVTHNDKIQAIITDEGEIEASLVILCAGAWSKQIEGIPEQLQPPIRPVKGQIISLKMNESVKLSHAIRAPDVYLVPKSDGRLLVGATNEEMGFDTNPTAGEIYRLLERGWETIPAIYDLPIDAIEVGLRPGSRDHEPIIGDSEIEGLYYATGHYRSGILLTPVTAKELSQWIVSGKRSDVLEQFQLSRFYKEVN